MIPEAVVMIAIADVPMDQGPEAAKIVIVSVVVDLPIRITLQEGFIPSFSF